jgi:uncharacterized YccA/Bax inhibitor family protein
MRTGNPALRGNTFSSVGAVNPEDAMTIQGTANKTLILLVFVVGAAMWAWSRPLEFLPWFLWIMGGAFVLGLITVFVKKAAPVTAPLYALVEGVLLGCISFFFEKAYPGIVIQAVGLTFGTLLALLLAYQSGWIKVTQNFRLGVIAATGGIALYYLASMILSAFFKIQVPLIHESTPLGIGFSVVVVIIAALNLVLDFDFIEKGAQTNAPKYMEWYGAFGLMVTLIWLYLEILRLLAKTSKR